MNLHETPDFRDALVATADHLGLDPRFVEKDYYVTEVLRVVAQTHPGRTIFKGGTSLSKGWGLIERFSEDIDLFVDCNRFKPPLAGRAVDRELKRLRDAVGAHPALTYLENEGRTISGLGREDYFAYETHFDELPGLRNVVLLEPGIQSGDQPTEEREISSLVGRFMISRDVAGLADDLKPFSMTLLHFRRTFVEKLFTIHGKVERLKQEGHPLGRDARHYADLYVLAEQERVLEMLRSDEYGEIKNDYDALSRKFYPDSYRPPAGLTFANSDAIFVPANLLEGIASDYGLECRRLFPAETFPSLSEVLDRLQGLRDLL